MKRPILRVLSVLAVVLAFSACDNSTAPSSLGFVRLQLMDASFTNGSVARADVYVVRIDARLAPSDSASSDSAVAQDSALSGGWKTIASPGRLFGFIALSNGPMTDLGVAPLPGGSYAALRLIIDTDSSTLTLKNGTVLRSALLGFSPGIKWPSAGRTGLEIMLPSPVAVVAPDTTVVQVKALMQLNGW
jgi:hypothetical protein